MWLNVLNKRVFGYRWLEQLSAGGVNWANDAVEQTGENEGRVSRVVLHAAAYADDRCRQRGPLHSVYQRNGRVQCEATDDCEHAV